MGRLPDWLRAGQLRPAPRCGDISRVCVDHRRPLPISTCAWSLIACESAGKLSRNLYGSIDNTIVQLFCPLSTGLITPVHCA